MKDLPPAIAAAEGLVDFRPSPTASIGDKKKGQEGKKGKGPSKDFKKSKGKGKKMTEQSKSKGGKKEAGYFICRGPHMAKKCPKRERLNAIQESKGEENIGGSSTSLVNPLQLLQ